MISVTMVEAAASSIVIQLSAVGGLKMGCRNESSLEKSTWSALPKAIPHRKRRLDSTARLEITIFREIEMSTNFLSTKFGSPILIPQGGSSVRETVEILENHQTPPSPPVSGGF